MIIRIIKINKFEFKKNIYIYNKIILIIKIKIIIIIIIIKIKIIIKIIIIKI